MKYTDFKSQIAFYGFTYCPLSEAEYTALYNKFNGDIDAIYSIACDLHSGFDSAVTDALNK